MRDGIVISAALLARHCDDELQEGADVPREELALRIQNDGPGAISLDAILGLLFAGMKWGLVALGLGVLGALPPLASRSVSSAGRATT